MMYDKSRFTYGLELEYADVLVGSDLPSGCCWNDKDYSIVNSSGIANDPKGKLWPFGGEINTRPTHSVEEQVAVVRSINAMLRPKPVVNYKCNLHVHIGVPGLEHDLRGCKKLLQYITDHQEILEIVDPLPRPDKSMFYAHEEYKGALARHRRNMVSHRQMLPDTRLKKIMQASTVREFMDEHAPISDSGKRLWFIAPRPGINIRQLQETKTVEFRHFFQTLDMREVESSLIWCREFMHLALTDGKDPLTILDNHSLKFPTKYGGAHVMLYDHHLHSVWEHTNLQNSRRVVHSRLDDMTKVLFVCTGNINRSPAAHTILKSMLAGNISVAVDSAGVSDYNEGKKTRKRMRDTLIERGYMYYPIVSKQITREMIDAYDLIIYMSNANLNTLQREFGYNEKFVPMVRYGGYDLNGIPDPQSGSVEDYRAVVELLEDCCMNIVEEMGE